MFNTIRITQGQSIDLSGKVLDGQTLEGVPFAHVFIEGTSIGAVSDLYGHFNLSCPQQYRSGVLQLSCLGYKPVRILLKNIDLPAPVIMLEQDVVQLSEVIVKPEDPVELLRQAFARIPDNYDTAAHMLSGYYKMSSLMGAKTVRYTEAFFDVLKPSLKAIRDRKIPSGDSIHLREVRMKPSEINDWKLKKTIDWENSLYTLEYRDIVKQFSARKDLGEDFFPHYQFEIERMVLINDRRTYVIRIEPKKANKKTYWFGHIFLDEGTKAFVKLDFEPSPEHLRIMKARLSYKIASKLYGVSYNEVNWKESVNYELTEGKWYLKAVQSSKQFLISSKKRGFENSPVDITLQYSTDSIKSAIGHPDTLEILPRNRSWWEVNQFMEDLYDPSFWHSFDQQRGVFTQGQFGKDQQTNRPGQNYIFTKLDTLQGALSPLRTCFDVGFYHLDVEIFPEEEVIRGSSLIRFKVMDTVDKIQVDLYSCMEIDSIIHRGKRLSFGREFNAVYISFPELLQERSVEEVLVYFSGHPVDADLEIPMYASFLWLEDERENPWLQAICQGYGASGWWPNKDHLSDEPDSAAVSVTVPDGLDVVSNGRLRSKTSLEHGKVRYDWFVSYPINNYNLTLNVGRYAHITDQYANATGTLDLDYYVMEYNLENARKKVEIVKPMLRTYEELFGKYPFPRDGFKLVETPYAMEHQSCVSLGYEYFSESYDYDLEMLEDGLKNGQIDFQIVLHETAHEWWGNSVSCTDNAELWIHEAFATYAEALYIEEHYGYENAQTYLNSMKAGVKNKAPMIGKFGVNHIHYDINDIYLKGALMLNTLRHVIENDSVWFSILKGIPSDFQYKMVTTEDIVEYVNRKTETDYTWFFNQYLRSAEIPRLELVFENIEGKSYLNYRWATQMKEFKMPVEYKTTQGDTARLFPVSDWRRMEMNPDDFKVNEEQFYMIIDVKNLN